jgi:general secretion pathway protein B
MSYILDALKKSEKERQRGTAPDILTAQDVQAQKPKKRPLWPYLLLVALLLNTGVLLLWLGPWHSKKPHVVVQPVGGQQHESNTLESVHEGSDVRSSVSLPSTGPSKTTGTGVGKAIQQDQITQTEANLQKDVPSISTPMTDAKGLPEVSPSISEQPPPVSQVPSESKPVSNIVPTVENKVYNLNDLPLSVQQGLPDFNITVAIYSNDPASRMVKINNQLMREGQYLTNGLKLEEITPDGVIFSYQNYRFRLGLK